MIDSCTYKKINEIREKNGFVKFALIDPDEKNDKILNKTIESINGSNFDIILVGGSMVENNGYEDRIIKINELSKLPIILFPGDSNQITPHIKSMLYLNLISGRNPRFLIDEQVKGAVKIKQYNIDVIPTAYILLDGGTVTSVQKVSNTVPLDMDDKDLILSHALAGEYLGNKIIYFDCGSGAKNIMQLDLIDYISSYVSIPIMVGGGILNENDMVDIVKAGASFVVCGTMFEKLINENVKNIKLCNSPI